MRMNSKEDCRDYIENITRRNFPKTSIKGYELDGYCEFLRLAFQYEDVDSFEKMPKDTTEDFQDRVIKDKVKDFMCILEGITLIRVPYYIENKEELINRALREHEKAKE